MTTQIAPNRFGLLLLVVLSCSICACNLAGAEEASERKFRWVNTPGKSLDLHYGRRPVLRYMYRPLDESSEQSRYETHKVFHHLYDPDGNALVTNGPTLNAPYSKDILYPHHRGLFFGFNRITYGDGKKVDMWGCAKGESQRHVKVLARGADTKRGWHRVAIDWHAGDGELFAQEERELTVDAAERGTLIQFASTLKSATGGTIRLDGDPQHAGFQFRGSDEIAKKTKDQTYYLRTDGKGKPGETRNWSRQDGESTLNEECTNRPWNAMSFVLGGTRYTALYLDHPSNPKPGRYSERDYGRFGSYFAFDLAPDKPLHIRYGLWLQKGEMTVSDCQRIAVDFVSSARQLGQDK